MTPTFSQVSMVPMIQLVRRAAGCRTVAAPRTAAEGASFPAHVVRPVS
jgi:hypothetical protein